MHNYRDDRRMDGRGYTIHTLPPGKCVVHERYGLWICKHQSKWSSPPCEVQRPRAFEHFSFSHLLTGEGFLWTSDGRFQVLHPGHAVIVIPGMVHNYGCKTGSYVEDSVSFTGPIADHMFQSGIISPGVITVGTSRRLLPIVDAVRDPSESSQIKANFMLQTLLMDLYGENQTGPKQTVTAIDALIAEILRSPQKWWTVEAMSQFCDLKVSRFRELFTQHTGLSPKAYLDQFKMQEASQLLSSTALPVSVISERLGYLDPFHFSRRFKTLRGESPRHYRSRLVRTVSDG